MPRILATLTGEGYRSEIIEEDGGCVHFLADADIDCDGGANPHGDPCWQPDTSLHFPARPHPAGKPIDSERIPGIVVPPVICEKVKGIVLGCRARVSRVVRGKAGTLTTLRAEAVVFDIGPHTKDGEISPALARLLGIDPDPIRGGAGEHNILYELWPGVPAEVAGVKFQLQPFTA